MNIKYCSKIFSLLTVIAAFSGCNFYKDQAFLACGQPNLLASYNQYKTNRDKSVQHFSNSEIEFSNCDQRFAAAFKDAEQKAFIASLDRANRSLIICKDDMNHEVDYNKPWLEKITADEMIVNYAKYKKLYPTVRDFDIGTLNKCSDYYKNFDDNQQRKALIAEHKEKSLMNKYRYKYLWDEKGLSGLIKAIDSGELNIAKAKQYIIKKDNLLFDPDLIVDEVSGNLIIYKNIYDPELKIGLQRNKSDLYARDSGLNGNYFVVAGSKRLKIGDKTTDVLIFKKIL